jgi:hypothetical protein
MQSNHRIQKNVGELLLGILVFTLIISVMNATMFNVVLPTISKQFQLSPSQVSWIITGYMIVYAIGSVTYGKLTDRYSLKNLLTFGLLFFFNWVCCRLSGYSILDGNCGTNCTGSWCIGHSGDCNDRAGSLLFTRKARSCVGYRRNRVRTRFGTRSDHCWGGEQYVELAGFICDFAFIAAYVANVSEIFR